MDEFNVNRDPFCQVGQMCDHRIHKYTRSENESSSLRKIETFSIEKYARRMCVFAGALWLPCFMDNCIMVYSLDGVLLQVIETYRINKPLGICVFDKGHLLVAAANGLFLMDDPPRGEWVNCLNLLVNVFFLLKILVSTTVYIFTFISICNCEQSNSTERPPLKRDQRPLFNFPSVTLLLFL